jgi:hypothetical protein
MRIDIHERLSLLFCFLFIHRGFTIIKLEYCSMWDHTFNFVIFNLTFQIRYTSIKQLKARESFYEVHKESERED